LAPKPERNRDTAYFPVRKVGSDGPATADDVVAVEAPLGIRLAWPTADGRVTRDIAVTMRTPGQDAELAAGFLFTEGLVSADSHVVDVVIADPDGPDDIVEVLLSREPLFDPADQPRNFFISSSCGLCGKASVDAVRTQASFPVGGQDLIIPAEVLSQLPGLLLSGQKTFIGTGSVHAAVLFAADGLCSEVYEDIGRHNAMDKLIGASLLAGRLPLRNAGIFVSGRSSFELVQKARMAGCAMLAAVGAPSSLAIELARDSDMSLLGFVRDERFNVYAGPGRIR
jgi:FdhD protein